MIHKINQFLVLCLAVAVFSVPAVAFETAARAAFVYDMNTQTVLLSKNDDVALPPASMSKLMTLNMVFEALDQGRLSLNERLRVSEHAQSYQGSTMYLTTRDNPTVEQLIKGVIVLSGNDASAVLAEALSPDGTESGFAVAMTKRAQQLGMTNSTFANSNGWPDVRQRMSAADLGLLAVRLISEFPQYYPWFSMTEFNFEDRAPANRFNRNPLLKLGLGADGLKTGHTSEAGYGLVGSARQNKRRIIFVLSGLGSGKARADEAARITNWAFRQFTEKKIVAAWHVFHHAPVHLGSVSTVPLVIGQDVLGLVPALLEAEISAEISFDTPIKAPIFAGDPIGTVSITIPDLPAREFQLVAGADVAKSGFFGRFKMAAFTVWTKIVGGS
jgi:D-alanyl-D-alanine carboxypeptidase (penicillin-binding protein 5/6)